MIMDAAQGLREVKDRLAAAALAAGRNLADVTLIAVSKTFGPEAIVPVLAAGQTVFGENRVQEAKAKWPVLRQRYPAVRLHLIGPLQSNKAAEAVALFDALHTIDREKIAEAVAREMARQGRTPDLFVQVNTGDEAQKAGVALAAADGFIAACQSRFGPALRGLMCIPPVNEDPLPHFRLLAAMAARHGLAGLSMGMSGDFEAAIAAGASHVRVGSAIFGGRAALPHPAPR